MGKDNLSSSGDTLILSPQPVARPPSEAPTIVAAAPKMPAAPERERTGVFTSLVKEDSDISGLVAYSIYKQNKLDWLQAFETALGRVPNEAELASYIIGESTPRRLATYRHLADSTLAGKGPDVEGAAPARYGLHGGAGGGNALLAPRSLALYAVIVVLFVVIFYLAAHYTVTNH